MRALCAAAAIGTVYASAHLRAPVCPTPRVHVRARAPRLPRAHMGAAGELGLHPSPRRLACAPRAAKGSARGAGVCLREQVRMALCRLRAACAPGVPSARAACGLRARRAVCVCSVPRFPQQAGVLAAILRARRTSTFPFAGHLVTFTDAHMFTLTIGRILIIERKGRSCTVQYMEVDE